MNKKTILILLVVLALLVIASLTQKENIEYEEKDSGGFLVQHS